MAFTFDTTVGGAQSTNTASVAFADAYFETRPFSSAWTSILDSTIKQAFLIAGAKRLEDEEASLAGTRANTSQRLSQPRRNGYSECDASYVQQSALYGTTIDTNWLEAECEMALFLAESKTSPSAVDKLAPFSAVKMPSGLELTMRANNPRTNDALPVVVKRKLARFRKFNGYTVERA